MQGFPLCAEMCLSARPMKTPQPVRGMQSLLGEDADRMAAVVAAFDRVRRLFGFKRVEVPVVEHTAVFARSIGESTDVVAKEMYSFEDRGGESVTLRPEFTAGICRAYLSEGWQQFAPIKAAAHGPAFRYERPQKGRFRQFHQLDAEIIGASEPGADVEVLAFGHQLLEELGIADGVRLEINTLGDPETREAWRSALVGYFRDRRSELSDESRDRLDRNPLRILDSKDGRDKAVCEDAPGVDQFLSANASKFFAAVSAGLDSAGIRWTRNPRLVRGLDYYRHTAFEFVTERLGAQGTVLAGGRYDGLVESLGGPHTPAVGWAAGIERLAMMIDPPRDDGIWVAIVPLGDSAQLAGQAMLADLRRAGIAADMGLRGNMKKRLSRASDSGARFAVIVGDDELARGEVQLKDLASGDQAPLAITALVDAVRP